MQQCSNQRVIYLDLLRVIATFAVIFLHVCASEFRSFSLSTDWLIALVYDSLVQWCVPVFVMISGVLFLNPDKEITYQEIFKKRVPRLLLSYIFWAVFYVLYGYIRVGFDGFSIYRLVRGSLVNPRYHLWFLPMLMGVYLLIPVLRKIAQDRKLTRYVLVIWLVYISVGFFRYVEGFKLVMHFYRLFNENRVIGFSGYFLLGYYLSQQSFSKKQRIGIYLCGVIGAIVTIAGTFFISTKSGESNERLFSYLSIQVAAMATALFVSVKELAPKCGNLVLRIVEWLRKDLFGIYLVHILWLGIVNTKAFRHCCSVIITLPLITVIIFILSLFTTKLIRLIPFLRRVVE